MGSGTPGHMALMQGHPGPGDSLHEGHGRIAVDVRAMHPLLLQHREHAARGLVAHHARGDHGAAHHDPVLPDGQPLFGEGDRQDDGSAGLVGKARQRAGRRWRGGLCSAEPRQGGVNRRKRQNQQRQTREGQRAAERATGGSVEAAGAACGRRGHDQSGLWMAKSFKHPTPIQSP